MEVLKLNNIDKKYSGKEILTGLNLEIRKGEIFGLVGLNGTGKTTLIKIILNLTNADGGDGYVCGKNIKDYKSRENIFYLPEKFQPSQNLRALEFIKIFVNKRDFDLEKIGELCDLLGLERISLNKKIGNLSKGMSQKIGLILSMLENKELIILDEPMSGLDPYARISLMELLKKYKKEGRSVFFSSHIFSDIDGICDRIGVLNNKSIQFIGTPEQFKAKYNADSLEKAFLKEINCNL
jgi:ABC-2 type transport system ATP-binding protein